MRGKSGFVNPDISSSQTALRAEPGATRVFVCMTGRVCHGRSGPSFILRATDMPDIAKRIVRCNAEIAAITASLSSVDRLQKLGPVIAQYGLLMRPKTQF